MCSQAFWWGENTNDHQARARLLKGTHVYVSHLCKLTSALLARHVEGATAVGQI